MNESMHELRTIAMDDDRSSYQRRQAFETLFKTPEYRDDAEMILDLLAAEDRSLRGDLVRAMTQIGDPVFNLFLAKALEDPDDYVKRDALKGLEACTDPVIAECVETLAATAGLSLKSAAERTLDRIRTNIANQPEPEPEPVPEPEPTPSPEPEPALTPETEVAKEEPPEVPEVTVRKEAPEVPEVKTKQKKKSKQKAKAKPQYFQPPAVPPPLPREDPPPIEPEIVDDDDSYDSDEDGWQPAKDVDVDLFKDAAENYAASQGDNPGCGKACGCIVALFMMFVAGSIILRVLQKVF